MTNLAWHGPFELLGTLPKTNECCQPSTMEMVVSISVMATSKKHLQQFVLVGPLGTPDGQDFFRHQFGLAIPTKTIQEGTGMRVSDKVDCHPRSKKWVFKTVFKHWGQGSKNHKTKQSSFGSTLLVICVIQGAAWEAARVLRVRWQ